MVRPNAGDGLSPELRRTGQARSTPRGIQADRLDAGGLRGDNAGSLTGGPSMSRRRVSVRIATALLCLGTATVAVAAGPSVESRLEAAGIKYTRDDDGDYKITYNYSKEGRTQLVFVSGDTQKVGAFEIREIFSPAARIGKDGVDADKAFELMEKNRNYILGAWEISGDVLYFVLKLPDTMTAAELESAMDIASESADDMEIELSGDRDDL